MTTTRNEVVLSSLRSGDAFFFIPDEGSGEERVLSCEWVGFLPKDFIPGEDSLVLNEASELRRIFSEIQIPPGCRRVRVIGLESGGPLLPKNFSTEKHILVRKRDDRETFFFLPKETPVIPR